MIRFFNVTKRYKSGNGIFNLTFDLFSSRITGIVGHNGSGKTTTFKLLSKLYQKNEGEIKIDGIDVEDYEVNKIGFLPEERSLYRNCNVNEYLTLIGRIKGLDKKDIKDRIEECLSLFNINKYLYSNIYQLSKGNQQLISIIASFIHKPKLLLLDEPFDGLDKDNKKILSDYLLDYVKGNYVLISTHNEKDKEALIDECIYLKDGRLWKKE